VILDTLRNKIGSNEFLLLLKKVNEQEIGDTQALLSLLTLLNGENVSNWLEKQLSL